MTATTGDQLIFNLKDSADNKFILRFIKYVDYHFFQTGYGKPLLLAQARFHKIHADSYI